MSDGRELMSSVDAAWLRMDRPENPMVIVGVMVFDGRLELERVRRTIATRFLCFPRFRALPDHDLGLPIWRSGPEPDLAAHVVGVRLPAPAGRRQLEDLASRLASEPLDPTRPLWQFHVVERFGQGSALVIRVHHCYADGMALVRVVLSMTGPDSRNSLRRRPPDETDHPAAPGWLGRGMSLVRQASHVNDIARHALGIAMEAARVIGLPDEPATRLRGAIGRRKRAAWAEPLPLDEVRTVAHALGVSINDVLMATVAGALGSYLRDAGTDTAGLTLRAAVPVNLRHPDTVAELGNDFGLVFLDLPVGIADPIERAYAVHDAMTGLKGSYQPVMTLGLLAALGVMPGGVENAAVDLLGAKVTAVVSNVPGPAEPRYLAGRRIVQTMFWVPQSGGIGVGISVLSYAGQVQFGMIADARRVPSPRKVVERFSREFEQLLLAVLMAAAEG